MKILLLGAGGFIGKAAARECVSRGFDTVCAARTVREKMDGCRWMTCNRGNISEVSKLIRAEAFDAVIDLIAYTAAGTVPLLEALDGQVGRYVLVSSSDVYRNYGLLHRRETGSPDHGMLNEAAPLRASRYPYRTDVPRESVSDNHWMDDYDKIPVEAAVRQMTSDWVICRLPMVYGPGNPQARFAWAIGPMLRDLSVLTVPGSWLDWTTTFGFVDNVGAALVAAAYHKEAKNGTFNLTDNEMPVSLEAWAYRFADAIGWQGELHRVSDPSHPIEKATADLDLSVPLKISGTRFRADTGFKTPICLNGAIERLLADLH
ncbi:MAG: NAD-dependent epimerase/dehydratase family protein [Pseudomonadota bacterium]